jgi:predicted nucleotidyltransferase
MADLFNQDLQDFIEALNKAAVEYILVGGYAVILHGYIRSTADMDVLVNKTSDNYQKLKKAFYHFGAPVFSQQEFLGNQFDVWGIGIEPNRIEVLNKIKGVEFSEAYPLCKTFIQNNIEIKYIHLNHLLLAKAAAGRYKDKADIEELKKRNTKL